MTLRTLSLPLKILATCLLLTIGIGYLLTVAYLYLIEIEPHSQHGIGIVKAVIIEYYGKRETTSLEVALEGSMGQYLEQDKKAQIIHWIRKGAKESTFDSVRPILTEACTDCHRPNSGLGLPDMTSYTGVAPYTQMDLGESIKHLARVSHIHLFGLSFLFGLTGLIFALSETSRLVRCVLIAIPFLSIWIDIGSWWLTKYQPLFGYTVITGGALMGLSLGGQILISLYEMWFGRSER